MSQAVCSDLEFVERDKSKGGCCCGSMTVFRSVWDRLVRQLFGAIPPGMDTDDILPDITIWKEGVTLQSEVDGSYSFTVTTTDGSSPKPQDVIQYNDQFYIIGEVA